MRKQIAYIVAFLLTVFSFPLSAQEKADGEGEKAFDPKETIFEHLLAGAGFCCAKYMRMAFYELFADTVCNIVKRKRALFFFYARMEHHLQQHIAQFFP